MMVECMTLKGASKRVYDQRSFWPTKVEAWFSVSRIDGRTGNRCARPKLNSTLARFRVREW